jgi:hypothetical protein
MDADSGGPVSPFPSPAPQPSTIVFRDWYMLFVFVGNARVAIGAGEWHLLSFAQIPRSSEPRFSGRDWPSYHHAALSLCGNILAAVEHAIDRMKVADMPKFGPLPIDLEKRLRLLVVTDFDPAILQQGCINEAARAGLNTGTWREPTTLYSRNARATLTIIPVPGDGEKITDNLEQLHLDYFYMLGALCSSRTVPVNVQPKPAAPIKLAVVPPPTAPLETGWADSYLSPAQVDILLALHKAAGRLLTKQKLAEAVGLNGPSGGFGKDTKRLKGLELIDNRGHGYFLTEKGKSEAERRAR